MWEKGYILLYIKANKGVSRDTIKGRLTLDHLEDAYLNNLIDKCIKAELVDENGNLKLTDKGCKVIDKLFNKNPDMKLVLVSNDKDEIMSYQEAYKSDKNVVYDFNDYYDRFKKAKEILE